MAVQVSYPGVYLEELPVRRPPVTGVATSIAAFVGYTGRGRDNHATRIDNFGDFERAFGGLHADSLLSYSVRHFYDNGGGAAYVGGFPGRTRSRRRSRWRTASTPGRPSPSPSPRCRGEPGRTP